jgi:RNA polymerase sigma-70 factor (ECF subfamily)
MTEPPDKARFATTHWSLVRVAGQGAGPRSREALSELCETYWYPLYAYVRRRGHEPSDAQDLTQAFFARLIEKNDVKHATPDRGRFRSYLIASMQHFLANEADHRRRLKRGGNAPHFPIEIQTAEHRYTLEPRDEATPERLFERRWALTVLDRVMIELRRHYAAGSNASLFDRLKPHLTGDADATPYERLGRELDMSEGAVKVAVHRLRRRFGALLRDEIARTVSSEQDIDEEIRFLLEAVSRR